MPGAVVIGVGNPYRCDDGVGPAVADLLRARGLPDGVRVVDSLGEATELIDLWRGAALAVVVDAVRVPDGEPGRVHRVQVPAPSGTASSHGLDLGAAVELARVLGRLPGRLVCFGVEVGRTGYGVGLSPAVAAAVPRVARRIARELAGTGPSPLSGAAGPGCAETAIAY